MGNFEKIRRFFNFRDFTIKKRLFYLSMGSLICLLIVGAVGIYTAYQMNKMSEKMVEKIVPQEKVASNVIRKVRGASISVHKIFIYDDKELTEELYKRAKERLDDSINYLNTLKKGGTIRDFSRGTNQIISEYKVAPIKDSKKIQKIDIIIAKIEKMNDILDEIYVKAKEGVKVNLLIDYLGDYDILTRDVVTILNEYAIEVWNEWEMFSLKMRDMVHTALFLIILALTATALITLFLGYLIYNSINKGVSAIIKQIKMLSTGEIGIISKLKVSKDELGMLIEQFNKLIENMNSLSKFKKIIEEDESVEDIYERLGTVFKEKMNLDRFVIYEVSRSKNQLKIVYPKEAGGSELYCDRDIQLDCELCRVKRTGHDVNSFDCKGVCKYFLNQEYFEHYCIPIILNGAVGGIVQFVFEKNEQLDIKEISDKLNMARQYINEAQPVIEAKRLMKVLKESALRDALTGLYNRRFLEESYESLIAGILRRKTILGLLMCDLDFFKQINDLYGHDAGDSVLKEVANVIRNSVRSSDIVIRFGGEEFLALLVDTREGESLEIAERIRERMKELKIKTPGGFIQRTISIGVSEFPKDTHNFWEAIKFADVALYKAKELGRDRVVRFTPDMWTEDKY